MRSSEMIIVITSITFIFLYVGIASANGFCQDIDTITNFFSGNSSEILIFPDGGGHDSSIKIDIPYGIQISNAMVDLSGESIKYSTEIEPTDVVIVNDLSGSMVYNCRENKSQPEETMCKIDDMKEATKSFIDILLAFNDNMAGLTSYSTEAVDSVELTNNKTALFKVIDTYSAYGGTCISCAIQKGIDLLEGSTKETKSIVLMTDGRTNTCTYGMCASYKAKKQVLDSARGAWFDYNISIFTIAFGDDADSDLMEQIANVSHGKYYFASETNISDVYVEIANHITQSYPGNPSLDIGNDGSSEWSFSGVFNATESVNFTSELQSLAACTCDGCSPAGEDCNIELAVSTDSAGMFILDNLDIQGCVPEEIPSVDHVVFYQVFYDTPGIDYLEEWLEIYNPMESGVDISMWRIYDNSGIGVWYDIAEGTALEPGEYITIARDSDGFFNLYGCYPDLDQFHRNLANVGDLVRLTGPTGLTEIDFVAWENMIGFPEWETVFANENRSILRDPVNQDTDSPADWLSNQEAKPRCLRGPDPCEEVVCDDYCNGTTLFFGGMCVEGTCEYDNETESESCIEEPIDNDKDGYNENEDCDDNDPAVNPRETEVCGNSKDDDCDGSVDETCSNGNGGGGIVLSGGGNGNLCLPSWECSDWSACNDGLESRSCTDEFGCNTDHDKPNETRTCGPEEEIILDFSGSVCIEGSRRCDDGFAMSECINNAWASLGVCDAGCENGACVAYSPALDETGGIGGATGFITGNPVTLLWFILLIMIIFSGAVFWKTRK